MSLFSRFQGRKPAREWRITDLRHEKLPGGERVSAMMEGAPVWIESSDVPLLPSPEGFALMFLLPALHYNAVLHMDAPVSATWMRNIQQLLSIFHEWWGYPLENPLRCPIAPDTGRPAANTASCFTGGVDSFFTLLHSPHSIDYLLFMHGFDILLGDRHRMTEFEKSMRRVAGETGKKAIIARTNLREHFVFGTVEWRRTHGAAIAGVGHMLTPRIGTLLIPSSYPWTDSPPCGSHWRTDPLFSSNRLEILHDSPEFGRGQKCGQIAGEPMVRENLRVCWENRVPAGNCSECEKCLRSMVLFEACGGLRDMPVFDTRVPLARKLDSLPSIPPHIKSWWTINEFDLPPDVRKALRRLYARTHRRAIVKRLMDLGRAAVS